MIRPTALLSFALVLGASGCAVTAPDAPPTPATAPALQSPAKRADVLPAGGGGDLTVYINGLYKFKTETNATWRADVTGGVPPYYYIWTEQVCWAPDNVCNQYYITEGADKQYLTHLVRSDWLTFRLQVEVKDSQGQYVTGSRAGDMFGPGYYTVSPDLGNFDCGMTDYWPFVEFGGLHTGELYYRDSCSGAKVYQTP